VPIATECSAAQVYARGRGSVGTSQQTTRQREEERRPTT